MNPTYDFTSSDCAAVAVRGILRRLLETLRSQVDGVVADANIEHLHDLRVANRRTRTALSQIEGVLPSENVEVFAAGFKWISSVTGRCRDLDVALVELENHRRHLDTDGDRLTHLQSFLLAQRLSESDRSTAALRSARFQNLVNGWSEFLQSPPEAEIQPPLVSSPIIEVAGPCILRANKRLRKRAAGIDAETPAAHLHRLRIDGKKLRYLLEFFFDLYPRQTVTRLIKELKRLQDVLGDFNDTEVRLALIREFVDHDTTPSAAAEVEELQEIIHARQCEFRADFVERLADFASDENRYLYKRTFRTG